MTMIPRTLTLVQDNPYGEKHEGQETPHGHWDDYDMKLEGCRFNYMHELMSSPRTDETNKVIFSIAQELVALAHSKGYADQDSHLFSLEWDEDPKGYEESLDEAYEERVERSLNVLARTPHASVDFVRNLGNSMRDAVVEGRKMKGGNQFTMSQGLRGF